MVSSITRVILSFFLGADEQMMNFPCQSSGTALAALSSQMSMANFSICVFDTTGCKEKAILFAETSH